jgi:pSer/pThr/pTyr-binding forkhead associated (FHA) protein
VKDLDSTNGTFVNGARVTEAALNDGDRLGVGRVEFVVSRAAG